MFLVILFVCIALVVGFSTLAMHFSLSTTPSHRVYVYVCAAVAAIAIAIVVVALFRLHPQILLTRQPIWFAGMMIASILALVTSVFSEWKVEKTTRQVLQIIASLSAVGIAISMVMIGMQMQTLKQQMTTPAVNQQFPSFASSVGDDDDEEVRIL